MAMNSIALKCQSYQEDAHSSEHDTITGLSRQRRRRRKSYDPDMTEITVNIDSNSAVKELSGRFNLEQLRSDTFEPVNVASLVKGYRDPSGRRLAPRRDIQITVVLYTTNHSFRTTTQNISAGGAMLQHTLPLNFGAELFDILFIYEDPTARKKRYFMMKGQAVGSTLQTNRVQFKGASPTTKESFHKFVEELAA